MGVKMLKRLLILKNSSSLKEQPVDGCSKNFTDQPLTYFFLELKKSFKTISIKCVRFFIRTPSTSLSINFIISGGNRIATYFRTIKQQLLNNCMNISNFVNACNTRGCGYGCEWQ